MLNFVEIIRGIGNILMIMALAGAVAYVGDRVGHQVGRKRLSLFGIRPRYTSTIVAIATGMIIALVVTVGAIFASQEVKTALFQMASINHQIAELQARESDLEQKVNNGRLIVPVDALMVPFYRVINQSANSAARLATIRAFYDDSVKFVNSNYPRLGLKPFVKPPGADKELQAYAAGINTNLGPVMLTVTSDHNLFENDPIHFDINGTPDVRFYKKGQPIAQLEIPGKSGASLNIAVNQLQQYVSANARRLSLPRFLADNVQVLQTYPDPTRMQQMIDKPGTFLLTAFAAEDFYPHLGGIPVVVVLIQQPAP